MSRKKNLTLNTVASLGLQIITVISGLIIPRLLMGSFGSDINGLLQSISKFLTLITLMEFGIGAVLQSSLYKPLAVEDEDQIGRIMTSGAKLYHRIAIVLGVYVVCLGVGMSIFFLDSYDFAFTFALVLIVSVGSFAQYLFGAVDQVFLNAAQKGYIMYGSISLSLILNVILTAFLIKLGCGIHMVKLVSSAVFLLRPFLIRWYINRHYRINRRMKYSKEPIAQKWNGVAQHFCYVILESTDAIVLTMFSTLANVSIYSVYNSIVFGIKSLLNAFAKGAQALIGDMIAKKETEKLAEFFAAVEFTVHTTTVLLFSMTGILILPFVSVYTLGITDANYIQPLFAGIIVTAYAVHTLRTPYNIVIMAAGHYKQTQHSYIIAAVANVILSIVLVNLFGLVGVSVGTLVAMLYQTVWMMRYTSKHLVEWPFRNMAKQIMIDLVNVGIICCATSWITFGEQTFLAWIVMALKVGVIAVGVVMGTSALFYRKQLCRQLKRVLKRR